MGEAGVDGKPINRFLKFLSTRTRDNWRHLFLTTNWDFLLQAEIDKFTADCPRWLRDAQVFHLNGTIEVQADYSRRSRFVLPEDQARAPSLELNIALSKMTWGRTFVVIGMGFECEADRGLFSFLNKVKEISPGGESDWVIVNPCQSAIDSARDLIRLNLPQASVKPVCATFTDWLDTQFRGLSEHRVFS